MALSVKGKEVESVLRELLSKEGYEIRNPRRKFGETGADIIARKGTVDIYIECIGFQDHPPTRSKQFYEAFFRAISRLKNGAHRCVMALPVRFGRGMDQRAHQYGEAWNRIGDAFPELEVWLVNVDKNTYKEHKWSEWSVRSKRHKNAGWRPRKGTIGYLVLECLRENTEVAYEEVRLKILSRFPWSKFNEQHFRWYKWKMKKVS